VMASNDGGEALVAAIYPTWKNGSWWKKATTVTENGETKLWKKSETDFNESKIHTVRVVP
jgi:hypothetical protein